MFERMNGYEQLSHESGQTKPYHNHRVTLIQLTTASVYGWLEGGVASRLTRMKHQFFGRCSECQDREPPLSIMFLLPLFICLSNNTVK